MNTKGLLCIQAVVVSMLHSLLRTRTFSQSCTGPEPVYSREIINKYGIIMVGSDDRKPRLFLFKDASKGAQFGVGTYIDILAKQAIKTGMDVKIVHLVPENNQPDGKKTSHHDIILKYQPPDHEPDKSSDVIDKENARILYSKFKPFLSQGTNIFHFNSTLYVFNFIEIL